MSMYNLIKYSDNYSKPSGSLWQYYEMNQTIIKHNLNHSDTRLKQEKLQIMLIQKMLK